MPEVRLLRCDQRLFLIPRSGGTPPPDFPLAARATRSRSRSGIALLVTLVVLALLAVFLTEFTFETTLETRSLQNFQASFQARNAVKSLFKAVLVGLEGGPPKGKRLSEIEFFKQIGIFTEFVNDLTKGNYTTLNPPKPVGIPPELIRYAAPQLAESFPNATFYTPHIRPIDHLFNLNRLQSSPNRTREPETGDDPQIANQFINLLLKPQQDGQLVKLTDFAVLKGYARLFDWLDKDKDRIYQSRTSGIFGSEDGYDDGQIEYSVKNAFLDRLGEIHLLPEIRDLGKDKAFWEQHFTVYPVGRPVGNSDLKPKINANLANAEEIEGFLERFQQDTPYLSSYRDDEYAREFYERRIEIAEALTKNPDRELNAQDIDSLLKPIISKGRPDNFFIPFSFWYGIRLKAEVDGVQAEVRAVVSVDREDDGTVRQDSLTIHEFTLR